MNNHYRLKDLSANQEPALGNGRGLRVLNEESSGSSCSGCGEEGGRGCSRCTSASAEEEVSSCSGCDASAMPEEARGCSSCGTQSSLPEGAADLEEGDYWYTEDTSSRRDGSAFREEATERDSSRLLLLTERGRLILDRQKSIGDVSTVKLHRFGRRPQNSAISQKTSPLRQEEGILRSRTSVSISSSAEKIGRNNQSHASPSEIKYWSPPSFKPSQQTALTSGKYCCSCCGKRAPIMTNTKNEQNWCSNWCAGKTQCNTYYPDWSILLGPCDQLESKKKKQIKTDPCAPKEVSETTKSSWGGAQFATTKYFTEYPCCEFKCGGKFKNLIGKTVKKPEDCMPQGHKYRDPDDKKNYSPFYNVKSYSCSRKKGGKHDRMRGCSCPPSCKKCMPYNPRPWQDVSNSIYMDKYLPPCRCQDKKSPKPLYRCCCPQGPKLTGNAKQMWAYPILAEYADNCPGIVKGDYVEDYSDCSKVSCNFPKGYVCICVSGKVHEVADNDLAKIKQLLSLPYSSYKSWSPDKGQCSDTFCSAPVDKIVKSKKGQFCCCYPGGTPVGMVKKTSECPSPQYNCGSTCPKQAFPKIAKNCFCCCHDLGNDMVCNDSKMLAIDKCKMFKGGMDCGSKCPLQQIVKKLKHCCCENGHAPSIVSDPLQCKGTIINSSSQYPCVINKKKQKCWYSCCCIGGKIGPIHVKDLPKCDKNSTISNPIPSKAKACPPLFSCKPKNYCCCVNGKIFKLTNPMWWNGKKYGISLCEKHLKGTFVGDYSDGISYMYKSCGLIPTSECTKNKNEEYVCCCTKAGTKKVLKSKSQVCIGSKYRSSYYDDTCSNAAIGCKTQTALDLDYTCDTWPYPNRTAAIKKAHFSAIQRLRVLLANLNRQLKKSPKNINPWVYYNLASTSCFVDLVKDRDVLKKMRDQVSLTLFGLLYKKFEYVCSNFLCTNENAFAPKDFNQIYLCDKFFKLSSVERQGKDIAHEALHRFTKIRHPKDKPKEVYHKIECYENLLWSLGSKFYK